MIVLDTNAGALWLDQTPRLSIWTTSITILELRYGIEQLSRGRRSDALADAFARVLRIGLGSRVLTFGEAEAEGRRH